MLKIVQLLDVGNEELNLGLGCWVSSMLGWEWGCPRGDERPLGGYWDGGELVRGTHGTEFFLVDLWVKGRSSGPEVLGMGGVGGVTADFCGLLTSQRACAQHYPMLPTPPPFPNFLPWLPWTVGSLVAPQPLRPHLPGTSFSFYHCAGPVLGFPVLSPWVIS